ncbi:MAG TPA: hypothetical protein VG432_10930 [Gemmatimonadaceae bacterium]|nr:hypothetical protein [Gemmatimonadaceae bacterium]
MSLTTRRRPALLVALTSLSALLAISGCHDSTAPENSGPLWVLQRPVTTDRDTVDTQLPGTLVVAVYDSSGRPLPRAAVSFRAVREDTALVGQFALHVGYPGTSPILWEGLTLVPHTWAPQFLTDSLGELHVPIQLGAIVGRIGLRLAVVGREAVSTYTVWFDVHAGAPARVTLLPHDTAVYVDRSYQLRARVVDRYGNARTEQPTVAGDSTPATATNAGLVTGRASGRARFRAAWGTLADTAWASVVPPGRLAAVSSYPSHFVLVNLDGSEYRSSASEKSVGYIAWAPSGARTAVQDNGGATPYCYYEGFAAVLDTLGGEQQLHSVGDCSNFMEAQRTPRFSHDEAWVYFERARYASGAGSFGSTLYRVHPDGTGLEAVVAPGDTVPLAGMHPAPSPSGRYLVYMVYNPYPTTEFRVLDSVTGRTTAISGIDGALWMQRSDTLVALRSAPTPSIALLLPDGSEVRSVPYVSPWWSGFLPYDVSPDGRWIVIQRNGFELVSLESGLRLPLPFTVGLGAPAWRP